MTPKHMEKPKSGKKKLPLAKNFEQYQCVKCNKQVNGVYIENAKYYEVCLQIGNSILEQ